MRQQLLPWLCVLSVLVQGTALLYQVHTQSFIHTQGNAVHARTYTRLNVTRHFCCCILQDCEKFLQKQFDLSIDFAVEDALTRLEEWHMVRRIQPKGAPRPK